MIQMVKLNVGWAYTDGNKLYEAKIKRDDKGYLYITHLRKKYYLENLGTIDRPWYSVINQGRN